MRSRTGTIFIIAALITLMAVGGLWRYWDHATGNADDWSTAGGDAPATRAASE